MAPAVLVSCDRVMFAKRRHSEIMFSLYLKYRQQQWKASSKPKTEKVCCRPAVASIRPKKAADELVARPTNSNKEKRLDPLNWTSSVGPEGILGLAQLRARSTQWEPSAVSPDGPSYTTSCFKNTGRIILGRFVPLPFPSPYGFPTLSPLIAEIKRERFRLPLIVSSIQSEAYEEYKKDLYSMFGTIIRNCGNQRRTQSIWARSMTNMKSQTLEKRWSNRIPFEQWYNATPLSARSPSTDIVEKAPFTTSLPLIDTEKPLSKESRSWSGLRGHRSHRYFGSANGVWRQALLT
ncbi:hypothetical protein DFS34DRAFT_651482 [Phlyctochytrium arcticum]|nr:hypothetical protein DFS34DRAFT_651482 [Phlyctochytrium arcticum]